MEEKYLCDGLFDEEVIKHITTLVDKVEQDSGCEVVIACPHSLKQVIKEAIPNKSVLSLSSEFMPCDDEKIWIAPN